MELGAGKSETAAYSNRKVSVGGGLGRLAPGLAEEEVARLPSPVRAGQPVIHKQQDFSVDVGYADARYKEIGMPRAL